MDVKIENGTIKYSESCVPEYISSIDEIAQRVNIACCMKKGAFALNKNLGRFDVISDENDEMMRDKLTMVFKEATINIPYSDLEVEKLREEDSQIIAKVKISCGERFTYTEVSVDV